MDMDLLRPGTVSIAPETVLWFEFLLDPELLLKQLQKVNPGKDIVKSCLQMLDLHISNFQTRPL